MREGADVTSEGKERAVRMLEGWMSEYQPVVYKAAAMILRDASAAEDVAQETFIRAFRAAGQLEPGAEIRPWLYRIATNVALNVLRSRKREQAALRRIDAPQAEDTSDARAMRSSVAQALRTLDERLRLPVILRYYLDLPEAEIARSLGVRPGTVKSRLHEARRRLSQDEGLRTAAAEG